MNTIKIPNYPTHAVKHRDNSTGDGHIVFSMAFVHDHDFYYHENGNQIRQYVGDEILDVWNLQSQAQQAESEPQEFVRYRHSKSDTVWFYQHTKFELPEWAIDVEPYIPPAPEGGDK